MGTHYGEKELERAAIRASTSKFTSFSGTRSFAYVSGLGPGFATAAKWTGRAHVVVTAVTVFYTFYDIGLASQSAIRAWRE